MDSRTTGQFPYAYSGPLIFFGKVQGCRKLALEPLQNMMEQQYNTNITTNSPSSNIVHSSSVPEQHWSKIATLKIKLTMLPRKTWITDVCIQDL